MSTVAAKTEIPKGLDTRVLSRILEEGYGPGAWHGADMRAALQDVNVTLAFWRPAAGAHNIAEIALHHAWCVRAVREKLTGEAAEAFVLPGEDWFALDGEQTLAWAKVRSTLGSEQARLAAAVAALAKTRGKQPLGESERFELLLGVSCHAVYHAGQVQLIRRLRGA